MRRGALLEDAYAALRDVGGSIRGRLVVAFVNEAGLEEAGLDHGGLVKAFLEEAVRAGFAADRWGWALLAVLPGSLLRVQRVESRMSWRCCSTRGAASRRSLLYSLVHALVTQTLFCAASLSKDLSRQPMKCACSVKRTCMWVWARAIWHFPETMPSCFKGTEKVTFLLSLFTKGLPKPIV